MNDDLKRLSNQTTGKTSTDVVRVPAATLAKILKEAALYRTLRDSRTGQMTGHLLKDGELPMGRDLDEAIKTAAAAAPQEVVRETYSLW